MNIWDPAFSRYAGSCPSSKRCAEPLDFDHDRVGDVCDNCPGTKNSSQVDTDNDGVGDACDNCSGLHPFGAQTNDENPACDPFGADPNAKCVALTGNRDSVCVPPHGTDHWQSRCSKMRDDDGDGLANVCDSCASKPNPWQQNCNLDTETVSGVPYPYKGDACDPTPCSYADVLYAGPSGGFGFEGPVWNLVELETQLLPKDQPGAFQYAGTPTATVGVRTCECLPAQGEDEAPTALNCQSWCPLDWKEYDNPDSSWKKPAVYRTSAYSAVFKDPADPATFDPDAEFDQVPLSAPEDVPDSAGVLNGPALYDLAWDVSRGNTLTSLPGGGVGNRSLRAVFWTHVKAVQGMGPSASVAFRPWSNHYKATVFGMPGVDLSPTVPHIPFDPWSWPDGCPNCELSPDRPNWELDPRNERLVVRGKNLAINVSRRVAPSVLADLAATDRVRLTVAEGDRWLRDGGVRLASVSSDGTMVGSVAIAQGGWLRDAHPNKIAEGDAAIGDAQVRASSALESSAGVAPSSRTQFGAVLSATENALFIVGGMDAKAKPAGDLWQYDPSTRVWFNRPLSGVLPNAVLAATILPERRSLYVVDEATIHGSNRARLLEVDLSSDTSRLVGMWPRHKVVDAVFLSSGPDGQLVLAGSSSTEARYVGAVFQPTEGASLPIRAFFSGKGVLGIRPTVDKRGLTLPLSTDTGVINTFLSHDQLSRRAFGRHLGECL